MDRTQKWMGSVGCLGQIENIKRQSLTKDILDFEKKLSKLEDDQKAIKELELQRKNLIEERQNNKKEIYRQRLSFVSKINEHLKNSVDDFSISVKYAKDVYSPAFEISLKEMMGWRTSQVPKAGVIARSISVYDFVDAIKTRNKGVLTSIQYNGSSLLNRDCREMLKPS